MSFTSYEDPVFRMSHGKKCQVIRVKGSQEQDGQSRTTISQASGVTTIAAPGGTTMIDSYMNELACLSWFLLEQ